MSSLSVTIGRHLIYIDSKKSHRQIQFRLQSDDDDVNVSMFPTLIKSEPNISTSQPIDLVSPDVRTSNSNVTTACVRSAQSIYSNDLLRSTNTYNNDNTGVYVAPYKFCPPKKCCGTQYDLINEPATSTNLVSGRHGNQKRGSFELNKVESEASTTADGAFSSPDDTVSNKKRLWSYFSRRKIREDNSELPSKTKAILHELGYKMRRARHRIITSAQFGGQRKHRSIKGATTVTIYDIQPA